MLDPSQSEELLSRKKRREEMIGSFWALQPEETLLGGVHTDSVDETLPRGGGGCE